MRNALVWLLLLCWHALDRLLSRLPRFRRAPFSSPAPFPRPTPTICGRCGGLGRIASDPARAFSPSVQLVRCPACYGNGRYHGSAPLDADHTPRDPSDIKNAAVLGTNTETGEHLTLARELRCRHLYVIGKPGTGKTTLLKSLFLHDAQAGDAAGYIDPHGDAASQLLGSIPDERLDDVTYFSPTDPHCPAFNLLALPFDAYKLTEDIITAFKMFFDSWGPRMDHVLRNTLSTLLLDRAHEPHSIAHLKSFWLSDTYRERIVRRCPHDGLRGFWRDEFPGMEKEAVPPLANKLSLFLAPLSPMERIFSATDNALDVPGIMNGRGLLLANLSKGELGAQPSAFVGALLVTAIQQTALARTKIPEPERPDFFLYADEFQTYIAEESFETILTEARKYRLNLTLANQYLVQLPPQTRHGVFIAHALVAFGIIADDAAALRKEMHRTRLAALTPNGYVDAQTFLTSVYAACNRANDDYDRLKAGADVFDAWVREREGIERESSFVLRSRRLAAHDRRKPSPYHPDELRRALRRVADDTVLLNTLGYWRLPPRPPTLDQIREAFSKSETFPKTEFREHTFPDLDDFTNLPPHHAFARIGSAENVCVIRTTAPQAPNAETRAAILTRQRVRAEVARQSSSPPRTPAPVAAEEDFHFRF